MKTLARILNIVTSALLVILGAAFVFIEGFLLFSGDFLLFEIEAIAFIQMLLRLCLGAGCCRGWRRWGRGVLRYGRRFLRICEGCR